MSEERECRNCAYLKVRRGNPYCSFVKQKVKETYYCGKFKPR